MIFFKSRVIVLKSYGRYGFIFNLNFEANSQNTIKQREVNIMSRVCSVCGKGQMSGNNVSHSKRRTRRTFKANVQKVSYVNAEGKTVNDYVCARCLKSVERA